MSSVIPEFQIPNPLDLLFFAFDRAGDRLSLPGAFIHMHLELAGQVDVPGLRRAVACLHRLYPVTHSRLEWTTMMGHPRWRLHVPAADLQSVVQVHELSPAAPAELSRRIDALLNRRIDARRLPPLRFHVMRGLAEGDLLVIRWPHALMDARGGFIIMETIDRLYRENADPSAITSAGDERLNGLERLRQLEAGPRPSRDRSRACKPRDAGRDAQLPVCPEFRELGPLKADIRRLDVDECRMAQEVSRRLCPSARFGAFLRACAIRSLDRIMPTFPRGNLRYSVPYVLEAREPPYRSPVCRNLFSLDRLSVPARIASDRAAVAMQLHEGTASMLEAGLQTRHLATAMQIARLPTAVLGVGVRRSLILPPSPWQRGEVSEPPSMPMGFMQAFGQEAQVFCGAQIRYVHAFRPPLPRAGIGIQVIGQQGRLAVCGLCFEARERMMRTFLDDFVAGLVSTE